MTSGRPNPVSEGGANAPQRQASRDLTSQRPAATAGQYAPIQPRGDPNEHRQAMVEEQELENNQILSERRRRNTQAAARMRDRQRERERSLILRRDELMTRMKQLEAELVTIRAQRQQQEAQVASKDYEAILDQLSTELEAANVAMHQIIDEVERLVDIVNSKESDNVLARKESENAQARKEAVERVLNEKQAGGYEAVTRKATFLASAFIDQLQPRDVTVRPIPVTANSDSKELGASSASRGADVSAPDDILGQAFDAAVTADLSNALLSGLMQRSHVLLYAEDAWSEGYSVPLLKATAKETGTHVTAVDLPDWAVMTSHIDPFFEDLTIVSHPYLPPPDLESNGRGNSGMSFFANFNRRRTPDDEEVEPAEQEEVEDDADAEDEAMSRAESVINRLRARLDKEAGASSDRLSPGDDEVSDPALSAEMMSNPLSTKATEQLDRALADFVSTPQIVDGVERPHIIAIKHLGDLLNTRIGYTLFSRLVAATVRHNRQADVPVVVVGLLHPSMFHSDVPPPGIPPFDVNPGTPVALMPRSERHAGAGSPAVINIVADARDRGRPSLGELMTQLAAPGARSARAVEPPTTGGLEELPLFARIGIPPPTLAVQRMSCDMRPVVPAASTEDGDDTCVVGSLRQALVASQCLVRNAGVMRNICLLYQIPGFELNSTETQYFKSMYSSGVESDTRVGADGGLVFPRQPLYSDPGAQALPKQHGRNGWTLDQRALAVMLSSLPDDVAQRYFFSETFLHRWILLAQVLAVKEGVNIEAIRRDPAVLRQTGRAAMIRSGHLRTAWDKMLESFIALRKGVMGHPLPQPDGAGAAETVQDDAAAEPTKNTSDRSGESRLYPLHRKLNFSEAGVGRRAEDNLDVDPTSNGDQPQPSVRWEDTTRQLEQASSLLEADAGIDGGSEERASAMPSPRQRIKAVTPELTAYEKRLMGSVVDPQSMTTGFGQVCVKDETVTTLQEIITLPILRPEYFNHGVLQRHGVSGILLFGPPGTGKTMLAKAVARESGSVVLNIRGSDVYDKYFGEGEKLVEAVFSLARKLAPCVIFIDEVDALFSARSSGETNRHRRDIMNQIMSEWDGINSLRRRGQNRGAPQVMVMAATNRPFDLDDAILRRLPRRILVDLPSEADRAKILDIHLHGEDMDADVDLKALAARTQGFSGSDLKNMCVAAAQAVLRERVRAEVATLPETERTDASLIDKLKRVSRAKVQAVRLAARHFDIALKKVAPSSSDQMESLVELRKWDKLYGDGAQERNRKMTIGFANAAPAETAIRK
ncbi:hypothetical protein GGH12_002916 [Coemansia sp. RSA 1822]|nr:hypothetical protein LPJ76_000385 [Coemansia sp. RSA 638]KAJ2562848.1 hypothetical protein GGH12_002916 [Coemansia sp. RSA 1822]